MNSNNTSVNIFSTDTKFNIGDTVKVMGRRKQRIPCPFCHGNYKQEVDGDTFYCANCDEGEMSFMVDDVWTIGVIYGMNIEIRKTDEEDYDEDDYDTYVTKEGFKNVDYYINSIEDDHEVGTVNERDLMRWNER